MANRQTIEAPKANGFSVFMDATAPIEAAPAFIPEPAPLTSAEVMAMTEEPATETPAVILDAQPSMADLMRSMMAEEFAKLRSAMVAPAVQVAPVAPAFSGFEAPIVATGKAKAKAKAAPVQVAPVHVARHAKPSNARIETPKTADARPWYVQALTRVNKKTGTPFYSIETKSVMVHGDVAIARSNKYAPAVMLINGRRKPIYLQSVHLAALEGSGALLGAFVKANHDYLAQALVQGDGEDE